MSAIKVGSVKWNYLACKGSVIIVCGVHIWEVSCVVKDMGKLSGEVVPVIFVMSFERWPLFLHFLELFDYPIRKSGIIGKCRICKQGMYSVTRK